MNKRIIAVICLMLVATLVFVSCSKDGKSFKDVKTGKDVPAVTDKNGEVVTTIIDNEWKGVGYLTEANGEAVTDNNGETVTTIVDIENVNSDEDGKKLDTVAFSLEVPDGWEQNADMTSYVQLKSTEKGSLATMDLLYSPYDYDKAVDEIEKKVIKEFEDGVDKVIESGKEEIKLQGGKISPATVFTFIGSSDKNGKTTVAGLKIYVFTAGSYTYTITCGGRSEDEVRNTDFESVINAMVFK